MSKRNLILLIIILSLAIITIFGFLYFRQKTMGPTDGNIDTNFFSKFNLLWNTEPKNPTPTTPVVNTPNYQPNTVVETPQTKLNKVSSMPVAGFTVFIKERLKNVPAIAPITPSAEISTPKVNKKPTPPPTEFAPALRYVEKATGNIYQTFADKIEERKFSTTTIPKVYEARFGNRGESVIMRYLKEDGATIETFVGALPRELLGGDTTEDNEIKGTFLPNNIKDLSLSLDGSKIFYLFESGNNSNSGNSMIGAILNFSNNKKIQIFDSPFTEWLSFWPKGDTITLTTKPSANIPGYMYSMNGTGKNLTKILGDINGLTTFESPSGKLVLYGNSSLSLNIYHMDTKNSDALAVKTLPEKCVWGKASDAIYCAIPKEINFSEYPDAWYQGVVSFNDQFWKIDVKTGNATMILDPVMIAKGEEVDGIKLALDEGENYLFFVN